MTPTSHAPPSLQLTWSPPPFDWIKINTDAAILDYSIPIAYLVTSISLAPLCFNNHSLRNALVIVCKPDCSSLSSSCITIELYYKIKYKKISGRACKSFLDMSNTNMYQTNMDMLEF